MANNEYSPDNYPHRWETAVRHLPVARDEVHRLVDKLLDLEEKTHPANGPVAEKEQDSLMALIYAGKLNERLVGWALYHRAGLILNEVEGFPWPEGDEKAQQQADDHRHEAAGCAYLREIKGYADDCSSDAVTNRRIIAATVGRAPIFPHELRLGFSRALKALDAGEVMGLLQRTKQRSRKGYTLWELRLRAIQHVQFFVGSRACTSKREALQKVADAFGCGMPTVRSWEANLPKHFGRQYVDNAKSTAQRAGEKVHEYQMLLHKDELDEAYIADHSAIYGSDELVANAKNYQGAMKEAAEPAK